MAAAPSPGEEEDAEEPVWVKSAETLWYAVVNYEHFPEAIAWTVCTVAGLRVVHVVLVRWPRTSLGGAASWLCWLGWQGLCVPGSTALQDAKDDVSQALIVTRRFVLELVQLVAAWVEVFLPFVDNMGSSAWAFWWRLALRQRVALALAGLGAYALLEAYRMFRGHKHTVKKLVFHATFLVGGPGLWYAIGLLPVEWLRPCLRHAITTVPAVASLAVLARGSAGTATPPGAPSGGPPPMRRELSTLASPPASTAELQKLWLSYWACWPLAKLLQVSVSALPALVPAGDPARLQAEAQRAALTFVAWLQLWQGSRLLQNTARSLLARLDTPSIVRGLLGAPAMRALGALRPQLVGLCMRAPWLGQLALRLPIGGRLQLLGAAAVAAALLAASVRSFYSAVRAVTGVATAGLWCLAAVDTANTLASGAEHSYPQKLAFWVLARLWAALAKLPYAGAVLGLATPYVFAMLHLAGEPLVNGVLLPFLAELRHLGFKAPSALAALPEAITLASSNGASRRASAETSALAPSSGGTPQHEGEADADASAQPGERPRSAGPGASDEGAGGGSSDGLAEEDGPAAGSETGLRPRRGVGGGASPDDAAE